MNSHHAPSNLTAQVSATESAAPAVTRPGALGSIACLGGGHGLFQTLRAARELEVPSINAIVTVADDGGSSGRIRRELGQAPPGDLRMALAALSDPFDTNSQVWERVSQHRFGGSGALAGHAVGNLILAGLTDVLGSQLRALDMMADTLGCVGRVLPVVEQPLDIEAEVAGLEDDPRIVRAVRGQVAVATTPGQVRRVRLIPENPPACRDAVEAILDADVVTLGPGSWFTSVLPHVLVPEIREALAQTAAKKVVIVNLTSEPGETAGFSTERHIHMLEQHAPGLHVDRVLVDSDAPLSAKERSYLEAAAARLGAEVDYQPLQQVTDGLPSNKHDSRLLAAAIAAQLRS